MRKRVLGTGCIGATHPSCMAELSHRIVGVDIDKDNIAKLNPGEALFSERGLNEILERNITEGRLQLTVSYSDAVKSADGYFLAVGTPQKEGGFRADLTAVYAAVIEAFAPLLTRLSAVGRPATECQKLGTL